MGEQLESWLEQSKERNANCVDSKYIVTPLLVPQAGLKLVKLIEDLKNTVKKAEKKREQLVFSEDTNANFMSIFDYETEVESNVSGNETSDIEDTSLSTQESSDLNTSDQKSFETDSSKGTIKLKLSIRGIDGKKRSN